MENWKVNGIELNVAQTGAPDGVPVLLLHGFPESAKAMIESFEGLAEKGYRLIAPDQRGYNQSSKPQGVASYAIDKLAKDIEELICEMNLKNVILVGHDWGAGVAWYLTNRRPELIQKLIVINCPHYEVLKRNLFRNPLQMVKSLYILFFQLPFLPECFFSINRFAVLKFFMRRSGHPNFQTPTGSLSAMLNWYRAMPFALRLPHRKIAVPVRIIWGEEDAFLDMKMAHESLEYCANGDLRSVKGAGHWVLHQKPEEVISHIISF